MQARKKNRKKWTISLKSCTVAEVGIKRGRVGGRPRRRVILMSDLWIARRSRKKTKAPPFPEAGLGSPQSVGSCCFPCRLNLLFNSFANQLECAAEMGRSFEERRRVHQALPSDYIVGWHDIIARQVPSSHQLRLLVLCLWIVVTYETIRFNLVPLLIIAAVYLRALQKAALTGLKITLGLSSQHSRALRTPLFAFRARAPSLIRCKRRIASTTNELLLRIIAIIMVLKGPMWPHGTLSNRECKRLFGEVFVAA